jgi:hypothetical protein
MTPTTGLLTPQEASQETTVLPTTLAKWRSLKKGPDYVKVGGKIMYSADAIRKFLEARTVHLGEPQEPADRARRRRRLRSEK